VTGKLVLLVDDEKKVLHLLSDTLQEQGFIIKTTQPSEAMKILKEEPVDAVVLDLVMPGIDGISTLKAMKDVKPGVPVIMLSGHGTIEKAVDSIKIGAHDFLEKPVSSKNIAITLKNAISKTILEHDQNNLRETV
jgi:DNA-binding NtrC family response regulator